MTTRTLAAFLAWLLAGGATAEAAGQRPDLHVAGHVAGINTRSVLSGSPIRSSGMAVGAEGRVTLRRLFLLASYTEGSLDHDGSDARALVEGRAQVGVSPLPFLDVAAGPLVRAFSTPATPAADPLLLRLQLGDRSSNPRAVAAVTQRWLLWQIRGRFHAPILETTSGLTVRGFADMWSAVHGDVDLPQPFDQARGGEAGFTVRWALPTVFALTVSYAINETRLGDDDRRDTVERLSAALGIIFGGASAPPARGSSTTTAHAIRPHRPD